MREKMAYEFEAQYFYDEASDKLGLLLGLLLI